ncbi:MAG: hypothetical protein AAB892_01330 [Patescibacteria group bacterium]
MKMKYVIVPVLFAAVVGFVTAPVFAESGSTASSTSRKNEDREHKALEGLFRKSGPSIHINAGGRANLDAALVTAVSGSELTVKLFGLSYKVNIANAQKKEGTIAVDSRVWVKGKVDESTGTINAVSVRTFTPKDKEDDDSDDDTASTTNRTGKPNKLQEELQKLLEKLKALRGD